MSASPLMYCFIESSIMIFYWRHVGMSPNCSSAQCFPSTTMRNATPIPKPVPGVTVRKVTEFSWTQPNRVGHRVDTCRCLFRQVSKCRQAVTQRKRREGHTGRLQRSQRATVFKCRGASTSDTVSTRSRDQQFTSFLHSITSHDLGPTDVQADRLRQTSKAPSTFQLTSA